jgi:hypothetical protein
MERVFRVRMHLSGYHESFSAQFTLKRGHALGGDIELISLGKLKRFVAAQQVYMRRLALSQPKNNAFLIVPAGFAQVSQCLIDGCARAFQEH